MRFQTLWEGRHIFALLLLAGGAGWGLNWPWLTALAAGGILFCLNFFRDPDRRGSSDPRDVLSAADGTVTEVVEMVEDEFVKRPMKRIGVFLSVLDVHTNRAPIDGKVTYLNHFPGTYPGPYLDARNKECSSKNEAQTWAFEGAQGILVVRQITGFIARRIVPWRKVGDSVKKGDRFGMIRFGSRTEVFVPLEAEVTVTPGQKVKGGETVIARLPECSGDSPNTFSP
ncbi:MAG: phosphatidylserine decarboxylase family protein [Verrucomicrobia bacterium]|nr:phosphatidylserine decarboxylase family protein [Verrucomicrobiota bacterium]